VRQAIGSLHHKILQQKAQDIVIYAVDEDLITCAKLRTELEKKDEAEEETKMNKARRK